MAQESFGDYTIRKRAASESGLTDGEEDISGGVEAAVGDVPAFTLFLGTEGAVDVEVALSPDGGSTWYVTPESPVQFAEAGADIIHIEYNASNIRLTGSNGTAVEAQIREVV